MVADIHLWIVFCGLHIFKSTNQWIHLTYSLFSCGVCFHNPDRAAQCRLKKNLKRKTGDERIYSTNTMAVSGSGGFWSEPLKGLTVLRHLSLNATARTRRRANEHLQFNRWTINANSRGWWRRLNWRWTPGCRWHRQRAVKTPGCVRLFA